MSDWPFADPPNAIAYSTRGIMERGEPIMLVAHETDDGSWQFIGREWESDDLVVVCLEHAVARDPSVRSLADLPLGWEARRPEGAGPWRRSASPPDDDQPAS